eukprot:scaffold22291_cov32-Tisochrysis_lutea.AAC.5
MSPVHVPNASQQCMQMNEPFRYDRYQSRIQAPLLNLRHRMLSQELILDDVSRVVILVRDPFSRAMSAFRNKFHDDCKCGRVCFKKKWIPVFDTSASASSDMERYMSAIIAMSPTRLNEHFKLQVLQCLQEKYLSNRNVVLGDLEHQGMNILSGALGHRRRATDVMGGAYPSTDMCYDVSTKVLTRFIETLMPDYRMLRRMGVHVSPPEMTSRSHNRTEADGQSTEADSAGIHDNHSTTTVCLKRPFVRAARHLPPEL